MRHYSRAELAQTLSLQQRDIRNLLIVVSMIEPRDNGVIVSFGEIDGIISSESFYFIFKEGSLEGFYEKFEQIFT